MTSEGRKRWVDEFAECVFPAGRQAKPCTVDPLAKEYPPASPIESEARARHHEAREETPRGNLIDSLPE